jgi:membrane associated rhomboid family serine protease
MISFTVPKIIFWNVIVFLAWKIFDSSPTGFMAQNFLVSWTALSEGRIWTLLTSVYSHNMFLHIFLNMYVLSSFGPIVERVLGPRSFLRFYLVAGFFSSLAHALTCLFFMDDPSLPALGASGSIAGVILLFALLYPKEKILILGLIPIPALVGALLIVGLDIWGLVEQAGGQGLPIGHGAHLGGAFTGLLYYFFILRPRMRRPWQPPMHDAGPARPASQEVIDITPTESV